jgi:hypothetical protein
MIQRSRWLAARPSRRHRWPALLLAGCCALILVSACGGSGKAGTVFGAPQSLGNGSVRSYVTLDPAGDPTEVGIRLTATALDGLPAEDTVPPRMTMLALPPPASATVFDHIMLNWNSHGHPPAELFGRPHFDFHFYLADAASVMAINPAAPDFAARAAHHPESKYVPKDYVPDPAPIAQAAVPGMGLHWFDSTEDFVPGRYVFTQTFINGSWDGRYTFMEPMLTRQWLLTKASVREDIKQPAAYQRGGYFPTVYQVHFDDAAKEYVISLGGLVRHDAS